MQPVDFTKLKCLPLPMQSITEEDKFLQTSEIILDKFSLKGLESTEFIVGNYNFPDYTSLIKEISQEITKITLPNSRYYQDVNYLFSRLKQGNSNSNDFFCLNYLISLVLECRNLNYLAERLRAIIDLGENSTNPTQKKIGSDLKIEKGLAEPGSHSNEKKFSFFSDNYSLKYMSKIKKVLLFLSLEKVLSWNFKKKILKHLNYDIRIFNKSLSNKNENFMETLLKNNLNFFDEVLYYCKNDVALLKLYDQQKLKDEVLQRFYAFLEENHLTESVNPFLLNKEIVLNITILEFCFKNKLKAIINCITDLREHLIFLPSVLVLAFRYSTYEHLKKHLKNKRKLLKNLADFNVIIEMFKLKNDPKTLLDFFNFLCSLKKMIFKTEVQKILYLEFKSFFRDSSDIQTIICLLNPLLIFVALSQFLYQLSISCDNYHYAFLDFAKILLMKCKEFIENYTDFDHLKTLVTNSYDPFEKSVLEIIFEDTEFFFPFFEEKRLSTIVRHNLDNSIQFDYNMMDKSSFFKILSEDIVLNFVHKEEKVSNPFKFYLNTFTSKQKIHEFLYFQQETTYNVFKCIPDVVSKADLYKKDERKHFYQRKVFFSAISLKVLLDFITFLSLFVYILIFTRNYTGINHFFIELKEDYVNFNSLEILSNSTLEAWRQEGLSRNLTVADLKNDAIYQNMITNSKTQDIECLKEIYAYSFSEKLAYAFLRDCLTFKDSLDEYIKLNKNLRILFIIMLVISLDVFIRKVYQIKISKIKFKFSTLDILEISNLLICFVILMIYDQNLSCYQEWIISSEFKSRISSFKTVLERMSIFFGLFLFLQWLKITQYFKFTSKFGFIIKTIELMVRATAIFMIVYFINIAAFCSVLYVVFSDNDSFQSFFVGLRNLFGFSLGNYEFFDNFNSNLFETLITIIIIIFLVISNIVLLNLLIAILSNVFNKLVSRIDLENSYNYFMLTSEYLFDEKYGTLIFFPRSFNFLLLPLHLCSVIFGNAKLSLVIVNIYFTLYFGVILCFFLCYNIILMPLVWIKFLWLIILNHYYERCEHKLVSFKIRATHFFLWTFGGLPYLLWVLIIVDLPIFVKSAYNEIEMPRRPRILYEKIVNNYIENYSIIPKKADQLNIISTSICNLDQNFEEIPKMSSFQNVIKKDLEKKGFSRYFKNIGNRNMDSIFRGNEYEEAVKVFSFIKNK